MLRPREAGRLLDALGRIEHYEGFDDLFDLFERHVLRAEHVSQPGRSISTPTPSASTAVNDPESPYGPRGISLAPVTTSTRTRTPLVKEDYIADFVAALIRDLAAPRTPPRDGDEPDLDEEEQRRHAGGEDWSPARPEPTTEEWDRLVTACRKRVSVLVGRLAKRLGSKPDTVEAAAWLAGELWPEVGDGVTW
jgi:hypothetical protein